jgi:hypothetical protein
MHMLQLTPSPSAATAPPTPGIVAAVADALFSAGWSDIRSWGPGIGERYFDTAVGPKQCIVLWRKFNDGWLLSADYVSEGRNVVSCVNESFYASTPAEDIPELVEHFLTEVLRHIDASYARHLHIRWN